MKIQIFILFFLFGSGLFPSATFHAQRPGTGPRDLSFFSMVDETDQPQRIAFGPPIVNALDGNKDFILFNGTPDHYNIVSDAYLSTTFGGIKRNFKIYFN